MSQSNRVPVETQYRWVKDWIKQNGSAAANNEKFNENFAGHFGVQLRADSCPMAIKRLRELYQLGDLKRVRVKMNETGYPGCPKWVYGYSLAEGCSHG